LLLVGWFLLDYWVRKMTYPVPDLTVPPARVPIQDVWLDGEQQTLHAWLWPAERADAPLLLFFHGNGQNVESMRQSGFLHQLQDLGMHLLIPDYPGYGRSSGSPNEKANKAAAETAMDWTLQHYPDTPKIVMGWSLGSAMAMHVAATMPGLYDGLVLTSAWTTLKDVARTHYPAWLVKLILAEEYDSLALAPRVKVPTLIMHGDADAIIPAAQGKKLAEAIGAGSKCQWFLLGDYGHNDLFNAQVTWYQLNHFLEQFHPTASADGETAPPDP
jgi:hypothetical protein